jgi:hypothetical protein
MSASTSHLAHQLSCELNEEGQLTHELLEIFLSPPPPCYPSTGITDVCDSVQLCMGSGDPMLTLTKQVLTH